MIEIRIEEPLAHLVDVAQGFGLHSVQSENRHDLFTPDGFQVATDGGVRHDFAHRLVSGTIVRKPTFGKIAVAEVENMQLQMFVTIKIVGHDYGKVPTGKNKTFLRLDSPKRIGLGNRSNRFQRLGHDPIDQTVGKVTLPPDVAEKVG